MFPNTKFCKKHVIALSWSSSYWLMTPESPDISQAFQSSFFWGNLNHKLLENTKSSIVFLLTLIGMSYDSQKKCSLLSPPRGIIYKTWWAWQDVKLTTKKFLIFDRNSADKIWSKKDKEIKGSSLIMPIRVNCTN